MVELSQGDVTEVRRGGPESLRILSTDIARLQTTGYIRIERRPKDEMPRVGHVVFKHGKPLMAVYEHDSITMALEALLDVESDAAHIDALLAVHELPLADIDRILALHGEAQFQVNEETKQRDSTHQWWSQRQLRPSTWRREERLPELETVVEAPEAIRMRSKAMMQRHEGREKMMRPGDAYLLDSVDPSPLFILAGHLAVHGRPMLVIARHDIETLNVKHNIPTASCSWLSQSPHKNSIEPALENLRRKIDAFLWENLRAVVVIEGIEYLASLHGDERVVNFLRDIVDGVRLEDHVLLTTVDSNAFSLTTRERLVRDITPLSIEHIEHWNLEPDLILDHPLCALPNEEEKHWIDQQLQQAIARTEVPDSNLYASSMLGVMEGGVEPPEISEVLEATSDLGSLVDEWVTSSQPSHSQEPLLEDAEKALQSVSVTEPLELHEQEVDSVVDSSEATEPIEDIVQMPVDQPTEIDTPVPVRGPRRATRIKRKKKLPHTSPTDTYKLRIQAAVDHKAEAPELSHIPLKPSPPRAGFSTSVVLNQDVSSPNKTPSKHQSAALTRRVESRDALSPSLALSIDPNQRTPRKHQRENAQRKQTHSPLDDTLSIWDLEDMQRLEVGKKGDGR
tara:strand:- start:19905 stop:21773 length:1869 start_codon:yes stop_codon:yes gene_type:complete